jgi:hypothetical protein
MHAPYDRSRKSGYRVEQKIGAGILVLPAVIAVVLITLAVVHPKSAVWISQAVQAEFGGTGVADDMPVETAQPPGMTAPMQTVHAGSYK